jgi:hypothetical protein
MCHDAFLCARFPPDFRTWLRPWEDMNCWLAMGHQRPLLTNYCSLPFTRKEHGIIRNIGHAFSRTINVPFWATYSPPNIQQNHVCTTCVSSERKIGLCENISLTR